LPTVCCSLYCSRYRHQNSPAASVRLMFDGERCEPDATPLDMDMEDGDQIVSDAHAYACTRCVFCRATDCRMLWSKQLEEGL
jgi:hypothetical protein